MVVKHCEQDQCLSKSNLEGWNNLPQYRLPSTVALFLSSFHFRLLSRSPQLPLSISHKLLPSVLHRRTISVYFLKNWSPSGEAGYTLCWNVNDGYNDWTSFIKQNRTKMFNTFQFFCFFCLHAEPSCNNSVSVWKGCSTSLNKMWWPIFF